MSHPSVDKKKLIESVLGRLSQELSVLLQAAQSAREAATHEESKAEDQHDTRGLEASYLAGAQAGRAAELQQSITHFKFMTLRNFKADEPIGPGALVELENSGKRSLYFLVAQGGGFLVQCEGKSIQVLTARSPLGDALVGRKAGDLVEVEARGVEQEYEVLSVG